MFSGIVEGVGKIKNITDSSNRCFVIETPLVEQSKVGDSIAVNGVCMTITTVSNSFL